MIKGVFKIDCKQKSSYVVKLMQNKLEVCDMIRRVLLQQKYMLKNTLIANSGGVQATSVMQVAFFKMFIHYYFYFVINILVFKSVSLKFVAVLVCLFQLSFYLSINITFLFLLLASMSVFLFLGGNIILSHVDILVSTNLCIHFSTFLLC